MLGFVDKRDSQIKLVSDSKPHLLSRSDLESNAAWKSLCRVPQIVANPASNMTPSTVDAVTLTSPRHFSGPRTAYMTSRHSGRTDCLRTRAERTS
jgi:hypothetical protein